MEDNLWKEILCIILGGILLLFVIIGPLLYFDGAAKAKQIEKITGETILWYEAISLTVVISDTTIRNDKE